MSQDPRGVNRRSGTTAVPHASARHLTGGSRGTAGIGVGGISAKELPASLGGAVLLLLGCARKPRSRRPDIAVALAWPPRP